MVDTKQKRKFLSDPTWLSQRYVEEKLSTTEIARLIGCTKSGVGVALKRSGIPLRTAGETIGIQCKKEGYKSNKYPLLNNEAWLRQVYLDEGKSLVEIGLLAGVKNHNSVRQGLQRFGIPIRNISDGLTLHREDDGFKIDSSVITGCMLGDAMLKCYNKSSEHSYPAFRKKNKYYDHVLYVAKLLFAERAEERIRPADGCLSGKLFPAFRVDSYCHKELKPYFEKWYPANNNYVKVVPQDVQIDEVVLLHWFLDDGSTSFRKDRNNSVVCTFCSESFTRDEQQWLCDEINQRYQLKAKVISFNQGTGWRIRIPESQVARFFDIIGPCPSEVPSMAYKWKSHV